MDALKVAGNNRAGQITKIDLVVRLVLVAN